MKRGDFIDALAGEDAFAVEILVGIGDGARVDVEPALAGVHSGEPRAGCRIDADADARLEYPVSLDNDSQLGVNDGLIERMGDGADELGRGTARQLRVGIQSENVADRAERFESAGFDGECVEFAKREACSDRGVCRACAPTPSTRPGARCRCGDDGEAGKIRLFSGCVSGS